MTIPADASGLALKPIADLAGPEYADLLDELSDADRVCIDYQLAQGRTPRILFAALHARWRHEVDPRGRLPVDHADVNWWVNRVCSAPLAYGLSIELDGLVPED